MSSPPSGHAGPLRTSRSFIRSQRGPHRFVTAARATRRRQQSYLSQIERGLRKAVRRRPRSDREGSAGVVEVLYVQAGSSSNARTARSGTRCWPTVPHPNGRSRCFLEIYESFRRENEPATRSESADQADASDEEEHEIEIHLDGDPRMTDPKIVEKHQDPFYRCRRHRDLGGPGRRRRRCPRCVPAPRTPTTTCRPHRRGPGTLANLPTEVSEGVEQLRERLAALPAELPEELAGVARAVHPRGAAQGRRGVLEGRLRHLYVALAERGEEAVERIRKQPAVEEQLGRAEAVFGDAVELTEEAGHGGRVRTRELGEQAAKLAGRAAGRISDVADEAAVVLSETRDPVANRLSETVTRSQRVVDAGERAEATSEAAAACRGRRQQGSGPEACHPDRSGQEGCACQGSRGQGHPCARCQEGCSGQEGARQEAHQLIGHRSRTTIGDRPPRTSLRGGLRASPPDS